MVSAKKAKQRARQQAFRLREAQASKLEEQRLLEPSTSPAVDEPEPDDDWELVTHTLAAELSA